MKNKPAEVIEFVGMPRSGKTTQIKLLKAYLTKSGRTVKIISDRERAAKIATPPTEVVGYKLVFFAFALEEYFRSCNHYDYILIDRGFNDAAVWFETERALGHISTVRAKELQQTFKEYQQKVGQIFCLLTSPATARQRHQVTTHQSVDDVGMSSAYLAALTKSYQAVMKKVVRATIIDTTTLTPRSIHEMIIKKLVRER